jgi:hypothetical protein
MGAATNPKGHSSMWALLSTRLRTWLLVAVALPLLRAILHRLTTRAQTRNPGTAGTRMLIRAGATLDRIVDRSRGRTVTSTASWK